LDPTRLAGSAAGTCAESCDGDEYGAGLVIALRLATCVAVTGSRESQVLNKELESEESSEQGPIDFFL
jgi:hypothetical protein